MGDSESEKPTPKANSVDKPEPTQLPQRTILGRRLSRRRLLSQAAGVASAAAITAAVGNILPSLAQAAPQSETQGFDPNAHRLIESVELIDGDPLLEFTLAVPDMQKIVQRNGIAALLSAKPIHGKYTGTDTEVVCFVLQRERLPIRYVYAYFKPKRSNFRVLQFELAPSSEMVAAINAGAATPPLSGRLAWIDAEEQVLTSAIFRNNQLVSKGIGSVSARLEAEAVDYGCLSACLDCGWGYIPWWLQVICVVSCAACRAGALPACAPCAACLAGYADNCLYWCDDPPCWSCICR